MTADERLAQLLERAAPEPPRTIEVDEIARRVRHPRRTWAPLLAAACVLLLAVAVIAVARREPEQPATTPNQATTWPFTKLAGAYPMQYAPRLVGDGRQVFGYVNSPGGARDSVVRYVSATGAVAARLQFRGTQIAGAPALTSDYVVTPMTDRQGMRLVLLGRHDGLRLHGQTPPIANTRGIAVVTATDNRAYVASGRHVIVFDLRHRTIVGRVTLPAEVTALDATAGGRVYYGTSRGDVGAWPAGHAGFTPVDGAIEYIVVTAGGIWLAVTHHHQTTVTFNGRVVPGYTSLTGSGGAVWLSSGTELSCADPDTGRIRATSAQRRDLLVGDVTATPGHVLAIGADRHGPENYLGVLHPPPGCGP